MFQFVADHNARCFTGARKVHQLFGGTFRIDRDARRACLEYAEISHAPLGRVVAEEHHAIAVLDCMAGKESRGPGRQLAQIRIGVLFFMAVAFDPHRHARLVSLGGGFKHLQQVAIRIHALGLRAHIFFERRQHPLLQTRHVYVQPVVIPIELFRIPGQQLLFIFADTSEKRAHIVRAKDISVLGSEGQKHLERFLRFARLLFNAIHGLFHPINHAFITAAAPAWLGFIEQR